MGGLYSDFDARLRRLMADAPGGVSISDGYRSPQRSEELWHGIGARKYPDPEVRDNWYARPPSAGGSGSMHNHGFAADLKYASDYTKRWVHENAPRYGLHFPLSNEDWHIELAKPGGGRYSTAEALQVRQRGTPVQGAGEGVIPAPLPSQITNPQNQGRPMKVTDFRGPGAEKLMVVTDNLGKTFLANTTNETRSQITGTGQLNAALKLTGQDAPVTEFNGEPVYLTGWTEVAPVVDLFGGPGGIERAVSGQQELPDVMGGGKVPLPKAVKDTTGTTYEPENRYPDEPVPLPAEILARFAERRRAATNALEQARTQRQRGRAQEESAFEQFRNRLQSDTKSRKRDLSYRGAGRNLAFQPAFMGRGQREIRDQRADKLGQYQSGRTERLSALDQYVQDAKRRREKELAAIDRDRATLRSRPQDYMEALR